MAERLSYQLLADAVLVLHVALVGFVVGGLVAIVIGNLRGWQWVNRLTFRLAHLTTIGFVVLQAWLGATCPLTLLESWLREQAGHASYSGSFIEHWLQAILFYQAPGWVFVVIYSIFFLVVVASWICYPPQSPSRN